MVLATEEAAIVVTTITIAILIDKYVMNYLQYLKIKTRVNYWFVYRCLMMDNAPRIVNLNVMQVVRSSLYCRIIINQQLLHIIIC